MLSFNNNKRDKQRPETKILCLMYQINKNKNTDNKSLARLWGKYVVLYILSESIN